MTSYNVGPEPIRAHIDFNPAEREIFGITQKHKSDFTKEELEGFLSRIQTVEQTLELTMSERGDAPIYKFSFLGWGGGESAEEVASKQAQSLRSRIIEVMEKAGWGPIQNKSIAQMNIDELQQEYQRIRGTLTTLRQEVDSLQLDMLRAVVSGVLQRVDPDILQAEQDLLALTHANLELVSKQIDAAEKGSQQVLEQLKEQKSLAHFDLLETQLKAASSITELTWGKNDLDKAIQAAGALDQKTREKAVACGEAFVAKSIEISKVNREQLENTIIKVRETPTIDTLVEKAKTIEAYRLLLRHLGNLCELLAKHTQINTIDIDLEVRQGKGVIEDAEKRVKQWGVRLSQETCERAERAAEEGKPVALFNFQGDIKEIIQDRNYITIVTGSNKALTDSVFETLNFLLTTQLESFNNIATVFKVMPGVSPGILTAIKTAITSNPVLAITFLTGVGLHFVVPVVVTSLSTGLTLKESVVFFAVDSILLPELLPRLLRRVVPTGVPKFVVPAFTISATVAAQVGFQIYGPSAIRQVPRVFADITSSFAAKPALELNLQPTGDLGVMPKISLEPTTVPPLKSDISSDTLKAETTTSVPLPVTALRPLQPESVTPAALGEMYEESAFVGPPVTSPVVTPEEHLVEALQAQPVELTPISQPVAESKPEAALSNIASKISEIYTRAQAIAREYSPTTLAPDALKPLVLQGTVVAAIAGIGLLFPAVAVPAAVVTGMVLKNY